MVNVYVSVNQPSMGQASSGLVAFVISFYQHVIIKSSKCNKGRAICKHVYEMMNVKDPQLSVARVGHCVSLAGFCLYLHSLHVLNGDVKMMQSVN